MITTTLINLIQGTERASCTSWESKLCERHLAPCTDSHTLPAAASPDGCLHPVSAVNLTYGPIAECSKPCGTARKYVGATSNEHDAATATTHAALGITPAWQPPQPNLHCACTAKRIRSRHRCGSRRPALCCRAVFCTGRLLVLLLRALFSGAPAVLTDPSTPLLTVLSTLNLTEPSMPSPLPLSSSPSPADSAMISSRGRDRMPVPHVLHCILPMHPARGCLQS